MKKTSRLVSSLYFLCGAGALMLLMSGCKKVLDKDNLNAVNPSQTWSDPNLANAYLMNIYNSQMPGNPNGTANGTDEGYQPNGGTDAWLQGTATYDSYNIWNGSYSTIRTINILLDNIDKATFDVTNKNLIKGQGLFWRAWVYYNLVKSYGGVPLILSAQQPTSDLTQLQVPRSKTSECIQRIVKDLDSAALLLPNSWTGADFGKINKTAAMAFKGRVLLFFASPLWQGKVGVTWQNAYDANKAALAQCALSGNSLYPKFGDIWDKQPNSEAIMLRQYHDPEVTYSQASSRPLSYSTGDWAADFGSLELALAFPMKDGSAWGDITRVYDTLWKNRDDRFYATLYYNGSPNQYIADMKTKNEYLWHYFTSVSNWNTDGNGVRGVISRFNASPVLICESGFNRVKQMDKNVTLATLGKCTVAGVGLRFAEVLLNFGEAASQIGKGDEAMDALRQIRNRAGILPGTNGNYGLKVTNSSPASAFATVFLNERFAEFAYESRRWDDLRRDMKFDYLRALPQRHGLVTLLKPGATDADMTPLSDITNPAIYSRFTYTAVGLDKKNIAIKDQYYIYGIPSSVLAQNTLLKQNNNWGGQFDPLQ